MADVHRRNSHAADLNRWRGTIEEKVDSLVRAVIGPKGVQERVGEIEKEVTALSTRMGIYVGIACFVSTVVSSIVVGFLFHGK